VEHHTDDIFVGDVCRNVRCNSTPDRNETANDDENKEERPLLG